MESDCHFQQIRYYLKNKQLIQQKMDAQRQEMQLISMLLLMQICIIPC